MAKMKLTEAQKRELRLILAKTPREFCQCVDCPPKKCRQCPLKRLLKIEQHFYAEVAKLTKGCQ